MENHNVKRRPGRPKVLTAEERKNHKTTYMLNREWYCDICRTGRNYTLAGKFCHLNTKKHIYNHLFLLHRMIDQQIKAD